MKPDPVTTTVQSFGPLVGESAVMAGGRHRRGLEPEHHQDHRDADSCYASADVPPFLNS